MVTTGQRIKEALEMRGMKKAELARRMEVERGTISNWCNDKYSPNDESTERLAEILNVNTAWLRGYNSVIDRSNQYDRTGLEERIEEAILISYRAADPTTQSIVRKILGIDL